MKSFKRIDTEPPVIGLGEELEILVSNDSGALSLGRVWNIRGEISFTADVANFDTPNHSYIATHWCLLPEFDGE